jgi:hypothetical protein
VSTTPLGRPVVPPVPTIIATSSGATPTAASSPADEDSQRANDGISPLSSSRHTSTLSFGSCAAICSTSGANALWKIRHVQSKRSRSSRFSLASFRGLTGHQTAARREMPNTHANAIGSFADRIATLSPACTPERARARATSQLRSCTWP